MTIVIPPTPQGNNRAVAKRGNGKTLKEIADREQRSLARMEMERSVSEARRAAEDINRITELRRAQKEKMFERYDQQETKRAPQFQIDQKFTLVLLGILAAVMFVATAMLTADGTIGSSIAARFGVEWFGYILFGVFEFGILVFMLVYYINGSRMDYEGNREPASRWFVAMVATSAATVALSAYHVLDLYDYDWLSIDMWVGIGIRVAASVLFVLVSKAIAGVLFAKAVSF